MKTKTLSVFTAAVALTAFVTGASAETDFDGAMTAGAKRLTAEEITERLKGKTVTFVSAANGDTYYVFYGLGNEAMSRKADTETVSTGFHAVTDRDQVCIGWKETDLPRLRCVDVLLIDGVLHKFKADGSLSGRITDVANGNAT